MPAQHYPFIDLAVHASVRDHFAKGDAVAVLSKDLGEVLWANGAAAQLFGFSNIYDILDEAFSGQTSVRRQIESAVSGLVRTGKPQNFMIRATSGFSRTMAPATIEHITLADGVQELLLTSRQAGQVLAPGARARQIIAGFEGTGTHVAVLDGNGEVLAASSTFGSIGLAHGDIERMVADVAHAGDRLVKRMTDSSGGAMPTAIGRLADEPALNLLFAVEPSPAGEPPVEDAVASGSADPDDGSIAEPENGDADTDRAETGSGAPTKTDGEEPSAAGDTGIEDETVEAEAAADDVSGPQDIHAGDRTETDAPTEQPKPQRTYFDTQRIRDELNARLAKAEQERQDALPAPFEEARGLEVPSEAEDSEADAEEVTGGEVSATETTSSETPETEASGESPEAVVENAEQESGDDSDDASAAVEDITSGADDDEADEANSRSVEAQDEAVQDDPETEEAAASPDSGAEQPVEPAAAAAHGFKFDPAAKPARFVWKINRDGEFSEVSPEFAEAVGPHSADIVGRRFPDLARVFNLDPDHVISDLLNRRDTWSGKTVFWPIQGTDLVTPVDLAALPTYTRDRRFDGFRGFGIVRTGEARRDPEALGLALVPGAHPKSETPAADDTQATAPEDAIVEDEAALEAQELEAGVDDLSRMDGVEAGSVTAPEHSDTADAETSGESDAEGDQAEETDAQETDPFRGERPAIRLVETPMRRDSDKIIDLEARRQPSRAPGESLSPGEQAAFREIGARLSGASARTDDDAAETGDAGDSAPQEQPTEIPSFGKRQTPPSETPTDETPADETQADETLADTGDASPAGDAEAVEDDHKLTGTDAEGSTPEAPAPEGAPAAVAKPETEADAEAAEAAPLPSAFALPARQVMPAGMDADIIDSIPAALLVHAGDDLIHGNAEFFELTRYASLAALAEAGGLDHLLERPADDDLSGDGGLFARCGDGSRRAITARLRSVNWGDGQALLLALSPRETALAAGDDEVTDEETDTDLPEAGADADAATTASALAIEAKELRSILETATDGVVILNSDGSIRSMNGSACALFNYDEAETLDQPFAMLFAHESQRAVMDYVSGLADHGVSSVLNDGREVIGREASGGFLPLFMTIGRLSGSHGYCAVLRDITQWKRTEEELRNAKRAAETANSHKSDFLARVSHEIRTPLNAIIGFSEMMVEERFGPIGSPRYLEYAHDIGNSGKHVLDIVNDLLDISKIEAGQVSMEFVSVSLNDHLAESVSLLQPMANSQRVIIRTSLSASVPDVVADQRSIKQIALNLLSNAIRYTPSGGQIVVSTSYEASGSVVIRIRDTGIGMNRKELEQAMKPFGQVGPGPRQRGEGTGLGLPLTKAMVEANRAQFEITSAPGEGTLVTISFPPQRVLAD